MSLELNILRAGNGDALLVTYKDTAKKYHNILIDGGNGKAYPSHLKKAVKQIFETKDQDGQNQGIDLVVITHIDIDHIKGIIKLVSDIKNKKFWKDKKDKKNNKEEENKSLIKEFWFNCNALIEREEFWLDSHKKKAGARDGVTLEKYLSELESWDNQKLIVRPVEYQGAKDTINIGGAKLTLLSPSRESLLKFHEDVKSEWNKAVPFRISGRKKFKDYHLSIDELVALELEKRSKHREDKDSDSINGSSIAFLFEFQGKKILLLGDAHHTQVAQSLADLDYSKDNKLKVDYVKLSHHGSRTGTSFDLLEMIDCRNYIISTDGNNHNLPSKAVFAKILGHPGRDRTQKISFFFNYPKTNYSGRGLVFGNPEKKKYNFSCHYGGQMGKKIKLI